VTATLEQRLGRNYHRADYCPVCGNRPPKTAPEFFTLARRRTPGDTRYSMGPGSGEHDGIIFRLCNKTCMAGFINFVLLLS
jgi:hypothetical protein